MKNFIISYFVFGFIYSCIWLIRYVNNNVDRHGNLDDRYGDVYFYGSLILLFGSFSMPFDLLFFRPIKLFLKKKHIKSAISGYKINIANSKSDYNTDVYLREIENLEKELSKVNYFNIK